MADAAAQVDRALHRLDEQARVAQLFVVGVPLDDLAAGDALVRRGVGGVFLQGRSSAGTAAVAAVTRRWAGEAAGPRPWVAADQEGGTVQTLSGPGFVRLPSAVEQGALAPAALAALADGLGASLAAAGVTLDLAPVADVVPAGTAGRNPPVGALRREYGSTAGATLRAAGSVLTGLRAHGVTGTVKHFPGLGRVRGNTDTTAGVTDAVTGPDDPQLDVFAALARSPAAPFVMVSLARYPRLAPEVAAFSPAVVRDLLRGRLGVGAVVVSDDLGAARAVAAMPPGERAVRFLAAGGTLALTVDARVLPAMTRAVSARAAADPGFRAVLEQAVRTALTAKARSGLLPAG